MLKCEVMHFVVVIYKTSEIVSHGSESEYQVQHLKINP